MHHLEDDDLLQASLDDALDLEQAADLRQRLAGDVALRERLRKLQFVREQLADLADDGQEPPAGLVSGVMNHVRGTRVVPFDRRRQLTIGGGAGMAKKVMMGLAAAAVIVFGVALYTGFPPVDHSQGAVGAAKRYDGGQLAAGDVQVGDQEAQAFLQSDTFDRLMKDPAAVKLLSDAGIRGELSKPGVSQALSDPQIAAALSNSEFARALSSPELSRALTSADLAAALSDKGLQQALASADLRSALNRADVAAALKGGDLKAAMASPEPRQSAAGSGRRRRRFAAERCRPPFRTPDLAKALTQADLAAALSSSGSLRRSRIQSWPLRFSVRASRLR